ncbi:MAG: geranylgeranylglycerol-phosphate geranylgeranyltransferase [Rhodothermales bacterium]|nr:geranylgeranylglycerol-phosphate geranylgeranyltransferase [Rhodothermales bacterium]
MRATDSLPRSLPAIVEIVRPGNIVMMMFGVVVGLIIAAGPAQVVDPSTAIPLALAALSVALIGAGANIHNDVADLEIDRVNRPGRVLPSGRMTPGVAQWLGFLFSFLGIAVAFGISFKHVAVALVCTGLLYLYNSRLKRSGVTGNIVIGIVTSLSLLYGALVSGESGSVWLGILFAFLLTLAREIVKDVEDIVGDSAAKSQSLPIGAGIERSARVVRFIVIVTIVLLPLPYMFGNSGLYLVSIIPVGVMLLEMLRQLLSVENARSLSRMLKYSMFLGLVSLALGNIGT